MTEERSSESPNKQEQCKKQDPDQKGGPRAPTSRQGLLAWVSILVLMLILFHFVVRKQTAPKEISYYPDFVSYVQAGRVAECEIVQDPGAEFLRCEVAPAEGETKPLKVRVNLVSADETLRSYLEQNKIKYRVTRPNPYFLSIVTSVLPVVLIFGLLYFLFMRQLRSAGHGAMSFGKSRAKMLNADHNKKTFKNVAGIDEAKEEVQEIIEFLKDPKRFQKLGGRIPKGVLLMGPPGTGKTLLAKAIAGEADVPFFSISGSDFVEMFVGVGASRVRDMFEQGKKNAPCIIFIDEIDAVGRSRFTGIGGGHDEREQTLNALLVEMDGFETQEGVIIVAATNRPDVLDPALLRPGRFDRQIVIDLPTVDGREAILKLHSDGITLSKGVDLRRIARATPGFSGADLENLLNEAALLAARQSKDGVEMPDLEEARDKVKWGRERRGRVLDDKEKKITAYHEAGHALVMECVVESEPLHKITIIPRGIAYLGATMQLPTRERYMEGKAKLLGMLAGLMGGRVAEELTFGDVTSGAASDLKEATRIARLMVCSWGMSTELGPQTFGENQELMFLGREVSRSQNYSEETARRIDAEVSAMVNAAHDQATTILTEKREALEKIASALLERETIEGREVEEIIEFGDVLTDEQRAEKGLLPEEEEDVPETVVADETETDEADPEAEGDAPPAMPPPVPVGS